MAKEKHEEDPLDAVADIKLDSGSNEGVGSHNSVLERAKYIPLRLSLGERKMLRLVEASMTCCDYTTEVDRPFKSSARRTHEQLKGVTAVLRGLVTACDYSAGQKLLGDDDYAEYEKFFRQMFEMIMVYYWYWYWMLSSCWILLFRLDYVTIQFWLYSFEEKKKRKDDDDWKLQDRKVNVYRTKIYIY